MTLTYEFCVIRHWEFIHKRHRDDRTLPQGETQQLKLSEKRDTHHEQSNVNLKQHLIFKVLATVRQTRIWRRYISPKRR